MFIALGFVAIFAAVMFFQQEAKAGYGDILRTINNTTHTINNVNRASRGTMSTVEYSQRFTDRQQDRRDRKTTEKEYNQSAEAEYYKTIQETKELNNSINSSNL